MWDLGSISETHNWQKRKLSQMVDMFCGTLAIRRLTQVDFMLCMSLKKMMWYVVDVACVFLTKKINAGRSQCNQFVFVA